MTSRRQDVRAGGRALLDGALCGEQIEMTADCSRRWARTRDLYGSGDGAMLGDRLPQPDPGPQPKTVRSGMGPVHVVGTRGTMGNTVVSD